MKRWAKMFLIAGLMLAPLQGVQAQDSSSTPPVNPGGPNQPQGHGQRGARMMHMLEQLNLSEAQKTKIKQIMQNQDQDPQARRKAIMDVLTPEQRDQLHSLMQAQHPGGGGPGGQRQTPPDGGGTP